MEDLLVLGLGYAAASCVNLWALKEVKWVCESRRARHDEESSRRPQVPTPMRREPPRLRLGDEEVLVLRCHLEWQLILKIERAERELMAAAHAEGEDTLRRTAASQMLQRVGRGEAARAAVFRMRGWQACWQAAQLLAVRCAVFVASVVVVWWAMAAPWSRFRLLPLAAGAAGFACTGPDIRAVLTAPEPVSTAARRVVLPAFCGLVALFHTEFCLQTVELALYANSIKR